MKAVPAPSREDILEALEFVESETGHRVPLEDFFLSYLGHMKASDIGQFDDLSSWVEVEANLHPDYWRDELTSFRGVAWAELALDWGVNIPPIIIGTFPDEGLERTAVADGRGRVNYATVTGYKLHVWGLIHKSLEKDET